jgi:hypothetical protein
MLSHMFKTNFRDAIEKWEHNHCYPGIFRQEVIKLRDNISSSKPMVELGWINIRLILRVDGKATGKDCSSLKDQW